MESLNHKDIFGYYKMTIHDIPSFNVTSSFRLGIEWANDNCSIADYVMFVADDTFVNPFLLSDYIFNHLEYSKTDVYVDGLIRHTSLPVRKYNREGFVSKVLYPDMIFPPYAEFANGAILPKAVSVTRFC